MARMLRRRSHEPQKISDDPTRSQVRVGSEAAGPRAGRLVPVITGLHSVAVEDNTVSVGFDGGKSNVRALRKGTGHRSLRVVEIPNVTTEFWTIRAARASDRALR